VSSGAEEFRFRLEYDIFAARTRTSIVIMCDKD
jgi:hypothetical protein